MHVCRYVDMGLDGRDMEDGTYVYRDICVCVDMSVINTYTYDRSPMPGACSYVCMCISIKESHVYMLMSTDQLMLMATYVARCRHLYVGM